MRRGSLDSPSLRSGSLGMTHPLEDPDAREKEVNKDEGENDERLSVSSRASDSEARDPLAHAKGSLDSPSLRSGSLGMTHLLEDSDAREKEDENDEGENDERLSGCVIPSE